MIRLLCTARKRMEVWLNSDDAIRVSRMYENIRSLVIEIATFFCSLTNFSLLGLDMIKCCYITAIDACLFIYLGFIVNIIKFPEETIDTYMCL